MDLNTNGNDEGVSDKSNNSGNENKYPNQVNEINQSDEFSSINNRRKRKKSVNGNKVDHKPSAASSSSQNMSSSDNFNPQPSTSSRKTEMEQILEGLTGKEGNKTKDPELKGNNPNGIFYPYGTVNFDTPSFPYMSAPKKTYKNSSEYFAELREWLQQAYFWQSVTAAFPYFMMCQQFGHLSVQQTSGLPPGQTTNSGIQFPFQFPQVPTPTVPRQEQQNSRTPPPPVIDGVECRIPSFWKRIAAEFIDFLILFFVKIAVTYVAVDFFHFVEMDTFDFFQKDVKLAYKTFIQITQDIVILEMVHRLVVCAFETFWLVGGQNGRIGGSTPGKNIMGLRVLTCESSTLIIEGDDRIVVKPGTNLGLGTAFLRALTKNFVLALLIPTSFAFIFFPHNRTGYDMICNTIVVEEPIVPHRVHEE